MAQLAGRFILASAILWTNRGLECLPCEYTNTVLSCIDILTGISFAERAVFHSLAFQSMVTLTSLSFFLPGLSEFPPGARHVLQVETWLLSGVHPHQTPRMLSAAMISKSGGALGSGAPGYSRTWAHLIAFSRCTLWFFFSFFRELHPASCKLT